MTVTFNHTIVPVRDEETSARLLADILGLSTNPPIARFLPVALDNEVTLDYVDVADPRPQHYAFLVSEDVFDAGFARVTDAGITYHADPDGHLMELLTGAGARQSPLP